MICEQADSGVAGREMHALVIGGTGVLSRAVAEQFVTFGYNVTILTNGRGSLDAPDGINRHLRLDRSDSVKLANAISSLPVDRWDIVIDCICYDRHQAESLLAAIIGRAAHTIVVSTGILYDKRERMPFRPPSAVSPPEELGSYATGKAAMERVWLDAWKEQGHAVTILRPPHIIGIGCELGAVPLHNRDVTLINRLLSGRPLLLSDGGRQLFQVVSADDAAAVMVAAAGRKETFGRVYNVANPEILTGKLYFEVIAESLGVDLEIIPVPGDWVLKSEWGWRHSIRPWLFSTDELERDVGIVPSTPFKSAVQAPLRHLLARERHAGHCDCLSEVATEIRHSIDQVISSLSRSGRLRERVDVDVRMNRDLPQY